MDENRWKGFTQSNAKISRDVTGEISVFDGSVTGMNVELEEGKLIVQKWRFGSWPDGLDSTVGLLIVFVVVQKHGALIWIWLRLMCWLSLL